MKIGKILGATKEEIESKKFNIWVGISLGNKYFTKEHIGAYITWALQNTQKDVLVVIADRLYAIKLEALDRVSKPSALKKAKQFGALKKKEIKSIIKDLPKEQQKKVKILSWNDIIKTKYYRYRYVILEKEYWNNQDFQSHVQFIVKEIYKNTPHTLTEKRVHKLCDYVLRELPVYVNGAFYGKAPGLYYTCTIYPGLNKFDELAYGLQTRNLFPEIANKLHLKSYNVIVEGYVD